MFKAAVDLAVGYKCTNVEVFSDNLKNLPDAIAYAHNNALAGMQVKKNLHGKTHRRIGQHRNLAYH